MFPLRRALLLAAMLHPGPARGDALADSVKALYQPWQGELVALSPDGDHVAYTSNERAGLAVYVMAVNHTGRKTRIPIAETSEHLRLLEWSSATRLVFALTSQRGKSPIMALNLDGLGAQTLATTDDFKIWATILPEPHLFPRRTFILGLAPGNRRSLLVEAETPIPEIPKTLFSLDMTTGKMKELSEETEEGRYFYDQTGKLRIVYSQPAYSPTRNFLLSGGSSFLNRWTNLSEAWGGVLGKTFSTTVANYFSERAFPLGFAEDPNVFYYASNVGRDTFGIYAFDLQTKQRTPFAVEDPHVDLAGLDPGNRTGSPLILDPTTGRLAGIRAQSVAPVTHWIDSELVALQRELDKKFPERTVEIRQWSDDRRRLLLRVTGGRDPGRIYVYERAEDLLVEMVRLAPSLNASDLNEETSFEFDTPAGVHLTGRLTFPRKPRINPPPLLIDFSEGLLSRAPPGFDREAQMLAEMGFIVARVNTRGLDGFGIQHRNAIRTEGERAPVNDALAAIEWIARHYAIDRKRIATIGHGLGGYLAVRALQEAPEIFRCGVAIDAPMDPDRWLQPPLVPVTSDAELPATAKFTQRGRPPGPPPPPVDFLQEARHAFFFDGPQRLSSVLSSAERLTLPVMLILDPPSDSVLSFQNALLQSKLKHLGRAPEFVQGDHALREFQTSAQTRRFRQIEEFFNLNLYDYGVKVGPSKEVK